MQEREEGRRLRPKKSSNLKHPSRKKKRALGPGEYIENLPRSKKKGKGGSPQRGGSLKNLAPGGKGDRIL